MEKFDDIEELFREKLSGMEADPGTGAWQAIQQGMNSSAAGTTTAAASSLTKATIIKMVAGVAIVSVGIGITAGYFYSEKKHDKNIAKEEAIRHEKIENNQTVPVAKNTIENPENINETPILKESDLQQSQIIENDIQNKKKIIVKVEENNNYQRYRSSADMWITKSNSTVPVTNNTVNNSITVNENPVKVSVIEVDAKMPVASIKRSVSGGLAPLTVTFTSSSEEKTYEWYIDDKGTSGNQSAITHTFNTPGVYVVSLTVGDGKGKRATDVIEITVGEGTKNTDLAMKVETYGVNVFSPNGDNTNDYFFFGCQNVESFYLQVTDRYGEVYFETNDPNFRWDGTTRNGEKIKDGTYFYYYHAVGKDKSVKKDTRSLEIKR